MRCYKSYDTKKFFKQKNLELAVEKIMSIQDFVFKLSKKIQEQYSVKISRSHIYELIALNQGYKTYNAFVSQNLIIQVQYDDSEEYYQHDLVNALSLEIFKNPPESDYSNYDEDDLNWDGYEGRQLLDQIKNLITRLQSLSKSDVSEEIHFSIAKTVYQELLYLNIEVINFRVIRESLSHVYFDNGLLDTFELRYESDYGYFVGDDFEFNIIGEHLESILSYAKDRQNLDAYALVAGYYRYLANQIAPYGRNDSNFGSRWDNDKQKYIKSKETTQNKEKYDEYIKQAELYESYIKDYPLSIAEINFDADKDEVYQQIVYLCNQGDTQAIEYFLYQRLFKNTSEAWLYIYLAQLCDVDFTQDDLRAYNAYTGEAYDDYGPMEIAGREAIQYVINLPDLPEAQDALARKIANELFEKM
jgi:hypothetical protein